MLVKLESPRDPAVVSQLNKAKEDIEEASVTDDKTNKKRMVRSKN